MLHKRKKDDSTNDPMAVMCISTAEVLAWRSVSMMTMSMFEVPKRFELERKLWAVAGGISIAMRITASHTECGHGIWAVGRVIIGLMQTDRQKPSEIEWGGGARGRDGVDCTNRLCFLARVPMHVKSGAKFYSRVPDAVRWKEVKKWNRLVKSLRRGIPAAPPGRHHRA